MMFPRVLYSYEEVIVKDGATIRGAVKVEGALPKLPALRLQNIKKSVRTSLMRRLSVGPGQGVRYAVVTLEGVTKGKAVEKETIHELDNTKCRFAPHVQAASIGQFVALKNSDPILHTAHALFTNEQPQFNVGLYPGRTSRKPLIAAGLVKIRCEVHPWMTAYIMVTEHPYHAVSDLYGEYELRDIPPGVYQLKVWHESSGDTGKTDRGKASRDAKGRLHFHSITGGKKMNKLKLWILVGVLFGMPSALLAADGPGVGIVKGTITIGGKPATDAVVSIEGLSKEQIKIRMSNKPAKKTIDQRGQKFIPTVVVIRVGETVDFPNNDKSWHNVYSKGGDNDFDLGLYPPGKTRSKKFDKPGVSRILCNAHPEYGSFHCRERPSVFFVHGQPGQLRDQECASR